jgi:hypothetical protein
MIGISNKPSRKFNSIYYTPSAYAQKTSKVPNDFYQNSIGITKIPEADIIIGKNARVVVEKKISLNGKKDENNGEFSIIEKILQEQSKEITQLRAEIVELRDELHLSTLGSILVRFVQDSVFEENTMVIDQGTQMELKSPFNENEKGLWASRQIMGITSDGMEIRSDMVLIAKRISEGAFEPLVEILEK